MRPIPALAVCLCLLVAGCSGGYVATEGPDPSAPSGTTAATPGAAGTTTATPETTPSPEPTPTPVPSPTPSPTPTRTPTPGSAGTPTPAGQGAIRIVDGSGGNATLPVNATLIYERTARLLDSDARGPERVVVRAIDAPASRSPPAFFRLWGLGPPAADRELRIAAYVGDPDRVVLNRAFRDRPAVVATTLAHEYVHVVQFREDVFAAVRLPDAGPDADATSTAVTEGAAAFAADAYWRRYRADGARPGDRPGASVRRLYENASGIGRWTAAPYRFGYRYVRARAGDPAALPAVYDDPPTTTEQVLHPGVEEGPVALRTRAAGSDAWRVVGSGRRMGELFVRVALSTGLSERRAAAAADGWGADARLGFVNGTGARGFAWVLRFDDPANATEFEDALAAYLAGRTATRDGDAPGDDRAFRPARIDDRTVVVFAGDPGFVREATVRTEAGVVVVTAPGPSE